MVTSGIAEEVKNLQEQIAAVKDKVEDDVMCEKIRLFVYAHSEIQALFKADAGIFYIRPLADCVLKVVV